MKIVEPGTQKVRRVRRRLSLNRDIVLPWWNGRRLVVRLGFLIGFLVPGRTLLKRGPLLPFDPPLESSSVSDDK